MKIEVFDEKTILSQIEDILNKESIDTRKLHEFIISFWEISHKIQIEQIFEYEDEIIKSMKMLQSFSIYLLNLCIQHQTNLEQIKHDNLRKDLRLKEIHLTFKSLSKIIKKLE